ncbi:MAG: hypothetical protein IAB80_08090 [Bacteroidetes bacterium]|uniref:BACON domain-containing protein n=1 Tax=Candidatus Cryptobacteroides excrementipullorum TaxID=2840761 RepID=A0A9D9NME9_9BACT|nr:hypothetical protein [Candidatus Cryptobacteroides excrementipullorum]
MRKHFLTILIAGLAGVVFSATSCDQAESTPDPVFPDLVEKTVAAGETVELSFNANQAWTVSIPAAEAGAYFRLTDGSTQSFAVKGEAGDHTVSVVVIGKPDFENHGLTVSMTMGDRTEVIAKITLPANERYLSISRAVFNADKTDFATGEDGSYEYEQIAADSEIELIWPASISLADNPYRNYMLVDSSVEWAVSEKTDWISFSPASGSAGQTVVEISCNLSDLSLEDDLIGEFTVLGEGVDPTELSVKAASAYGLSKFVGIPEDKVLAFDADGIYQGQGGMGPFYGNAVSGEEIVYYCYYSKNEYAPAMPYKTGTSNSIISVEDEWTDGAGTGLISRNVSISMPLNDSEKPRTATLLAIPSSAAPDADMLLIDFSEDGMSTVIKPEYQQYIIATCEQEGKQSEELGCVAGEGFDGVTAVFEEFPTSFEELDPADPDYEEIAPIIEMGGKAYRVTYNSSDAEGAELSITGEYGMATVNPYGTTWLYIPEYDPETYTFDSETFSVYMTGNPDSPETVSKGSKASLRFSSSMSDTSMMILFVKNY